MKNEFELIVTENKNKLEPLVQKIKVSLLPKDPLDEKDVLVEIRPGAGGEEAAIWVGDLYKMYTRFAERNTWNVEPIELTASDQGGYSKIIFAIKSKLYINFFHSYLILHHDKKNYLFPSSY